MPLYEIAFVIAVVLFGALAFMQERMRQQVHNARFGNQEISPWGLHFSNNLLGLYGIGNCTSVRINKAAFGPRSWLSSLR
jgi:hypothetical protein